ncbi:MAG: 16S rRNA (uracil(1498)-N(3))-methyltransferase [Thermodesulfovibrio sp.]|nr:16S rRNA (uracil(1498)-N(3))-methyltransferase [Thermodesulfovibrio sp.]
MHRIFLPDQPVHEKVVITGEKAGYISLVLRLKTGDTLIIHDNTGKVFSATILSSARKEVVAAVQEQLAAVPESSIRLRLFQGILKGEKMDLVIQKTVELGVNEIVPVVTERSQIRETRKLLRWQKISEEAARQCGRPVIPAVHEVADLSEVLAPLNQSAARGIIFWEAGGEALKPVFERLRTARHIDLLTGPEGGFSADEVGRAHDAGFVSATLGRRVLRAETAAMVAVALCQYELGDLG